MLNTLNLREFLGIGFLSNCQIVSIGNVYTYIFSIFIFFFLVCVFHALLELPAFLFKGAKPLRVEEQGSVNT